MNPRRHYPPPKKSAVITDLAYLGNGRGIRYVDYEDTESYRITKMFINHREMMVENLTRGM